MRVRLAIVLLLLISLVLVPAGLYIATPQLFSWQAAKLLDKLGCQQSSAEFERPQWNRLTARNLRLEHCPALKIGKLQATTLELEFSPLELLRTQQLKSFHIRGLTLMADLSMGSAASDDARDRTGLPLPGQLMQRLPVGEISLELQQLRLRLPERQSAEGSIQQSPELSGQLKLTPSGFSARLQSGGGMEMPLQLNLDWSPDNHFSFSTDQQQQPVYRLQGQLQTARGQLSAQGTDQADLTRLIPLLRHLDLLSGLPPNWQLKGRSESHWQLQMPLSPSGQLATESIQLNQQLSLQLQQDGGNHSLQAGNLSLKALLEWQRHQLHWRLLPDSRATLSLRSGTLPHPALASHWQLQSADNLSGSLRWQQMPRLDSTAGALLIEPLSDKSEQTARLQSHIRLSDFHWQPDNSWAHFTADLARQDVHIDLIRLRQLSVRTSGTLAVGGRFISLNLDSGSYLSVNQLNQPDLELRQLNLVTDSPLQLHTAFVSEHWSLSPLRVNLAGGQISSGALSASSLAGHLQMQSTSKEATQLRGNLQVRVQQPGWQDWSIPTLQLASPWRLQFPQLDFSLATSIADSGVAVTGSGKLNLQSQRLDSTWRLAPAAIPALTALIPVRHQELRQALDIRDGQLSGTATFARRTKNGTLRWQAEGDLGITGVSGTARNWQVRSAIAAVQFAAASDELPQAHGIVRIAELQGPLTLSDMGTGFSLRPGDIGTDGHWQLMLHSPTLRLLGGRVQSRPVSLQLPELKGSARIRVENLDLQQILALQPGKEVLGNGRLSGQLPVTIDGDQIRVRDGRISARPPGGMLAWRPAAGNAAAAGNYGLAIAMEALSDFRYHQLDLGIDYQPDGTLVLDTALKGSNPNWQNGQPVDFNIRIEQNLLKLLKALQFSGSLSEKLDQKLQLRN